MDRLCRPEAVRVLIFTSPKAGSGGGRDQIPRLERLLADLGVEALVVHETDQLRQLAAEASADSDSGETIVVAAGGDGTLSLACATLFLTEKSGAASCPAIQTPAVELISTKSLQTGEGEKTDNMSISHFLFT